MHIIIVYNATLHVLRYSYLQHRLLPTLSRVLLPSSSSLVLQALALVYRLLEPWPLASTPRLFRSPPEPRSLFGIWALTALENFIPFEKFKRLNQRKYFVIPIASHKLHIFVTYKRLIWIQLDPFAHYNIINEVAHNSYNKIFPFGTPFAFLKRNKNFQW